MLFARSQPSHSRGLTLRLLAVAAAAAAMIPAAHATDFTETTDFSNDPAHPSFLGALAPGSNIISGKINTFGDAVGPHGERTNQDMDYLTFTVPVGDVLTNFFVTSGTSIMTAPPRDDLLFLGLAAGNQVSVDPSFMSAAGLLGWTLVSQSQVGTDILPAIGAATYPPNFVVPGATTFTGPLGAGTYSLWLYDGDNPATYSFNAVVAPAPEPATWMMMIVGFGLAGATLRQKTRRRASRVPERTTPASTGVGSEVLA